MGFGVDIVEKDEKGGRLPSERRSACSQPQAMVVTWGGGDGGGGGGGGGDHLSPHNALQTMRNVVVLKPP